jgi:starvation-inducible DNA-binding protein
MPQVATSLSPETAHEIAQNLHYTLSDTFMLYLKTHTYHWNVEGRHFYSLHQLFEAQYIDMWQAVDDIAERIRALGQRAPLSDHLINMSSIPKNINLLNSQEMIQDLATGHAHVLNTLKSSLSYAQETEDEATADLIICRISIHEKHMWMLKSSI